MIDPHELVVPGAFAAAAIAFLLTTWPVRFLLQRRKPVELAASELDTDEVAWLLGSRLFVVTTALVALHARGAVGVRQGERRIVPRGRVPEDASATEREVFTALTSLESGQLYGGATVPGITAQVPALIEGVEQKLSARGLIYLPAEAERLTRYGVYGSLAFGFFFVVIALFTAGTPVMTGSFWASGLITAVMFAFVIRKPRLTAGGAAVVKELRAGAEAAATRLDVAGAGMEPAELARAVAEAGTPGLASIPVRGLMDTLTALAVRGEPEAVEEHGVPAAHAEGGPRPEHLGPYGYVLGDVPHGGELDEIAAMCRGGRTPPLVWTPDAPVLVNPVQVPALFRVLHARGVNAARKPLIEAAAQMAFFLVVWAFSGFAVPSFWLVMAAVEAISVVPRVRAWRAVRRCTVEDLRRPPEPVRLSPWALRAARKPAVLTRWITFALGAVGAVQLIPGFHSVDAAGLDKAAVHAGEWWRVLTGPVLHGNPWHFLGNMAAWVVLGGLVEAYGRRRHLPMVWFVSAVAGSVASVALIPATSVGASGAIMGCMGYLLVLAWKWRAVVPPDFLQSMVRALLFTAIIGAVGYGVIDNAAHGGGLVAGALLGAVLIPGTPPGPDDVDEPVRPTDWLLMLPFFGSCLVAIAAIVLG